jgi:hypothetical protein
VAAALVEVCVKSRGQSVNGRLAKQYRRGRRQRKHHHVVMPSWHVRLARNLDPGHPIVPLFVVPFTVLNIVVSPVWVGFLSLSLH